MSENNSSVWLIACRPSGIIAILLWFAIALLMSGNASAANLVLNGDFETGSFTNWDTVAAHFTVTGPSAYTGSYGVKDYIYAGPYIDANRIGFWQDIDLTDVDDLTFYYSVNSYSQNGAAGSYPTACIDSSIVWSGSYGTCGYTFVSIDVSGYSGIKTIGFGDSVLCFAGEITSVVYFDDIVAEGGYSGPCEISFNPNVSTSNQTQQYFDYVVNNTYADYMYFVTSVWHAPYELPDLYLIENWLNVDQEGENIQLDNPFNDQQTYHLNLYATTSAPPVVSESFLIASSNEIYINRSYTGSIPPIPDPEPEPDPYEPDPNPIEDPNTTIPDDWNMTIPDKYQNVSWLTNYTGYFDDLTSSVNNTLYSVTGLVIKPMQSLNETVNILRYHISNSKNMVAEYSYLSVIVYYGWRVLPVEMQTIFIGVAAAGACIYLFKRRT